MRPSPLNESHKKILKTAIAGTPKLLPTSEKPPGGGGAVPSPAQDDVADFQTGERVWVNGNKPGHVQFVGGTQFAPGQWAGIVLDESIGKNDGSVAGVRYFQCDDGKGIFTRPSKLTRSPLLEKEANGGQAKPTQVGSEIVPGGTPSTGTIENSRNVSPGGKLTGTLNRTVQSTETVSNLSDTESMKRNKWELRRGERVLVRSAFPINPLKLFCLYSTKSCLIISSVYSINSFSTSQF